MICDSFSQLIEIPNCVCAIFFQLFLFFFCVALNHLPAKTPKCANKKQSDFKSDYY